MTGTALGLKAIWPGTLEADGVVEARCLNDCSIAVRRPPDQGNSLQKAFHRGLFTGSEGESMSIVAVSRKTWHWRQNGEFTPYLQVVSRESETGSGRDF